jgi:ferrous iron transport protein B
LLKKTLLAGEEAPFVMELPPYRRPALRVVLLKMTERARLYLGKAATTILAISILLWAASSFPKPNHYAVDQAIARGEIVVVPEPSGVPSAAGKAAARRLTLDQVASYRSSERLESSTMGQVGRWLEPAFAPLGFDARLVTALLGAFAAKEVFVAEMGIAYAIADNQPGIEPLRAKLSADYPPLVGLSLMLFLLIATPCMATVAVTRRESGSSGWAWLQFGGLTAIAYLLSLVTYQVGHLLL